MVIEIYSKVKTISYFYFILLWLALSVFAVFIPLTVVENVFDLNPAEENPVFEIEKENIYVFFILSTIISPAVETLIHIGLVKLFFFFSFLVLVSNYQKYKNEVLRYACLFSAIVFGVAHFYSLSYILMAIYLGLFFSAIYYICIKRNNHPFFPVFITHGFYNFVVIISERFI